MYDVVLLYEHKAREMESILLLKVELEKRGMKVCIYNIYELTTIKFLFQKVKIAVTPFLYGNEEIQKYVYNILGPVNKICNLQWEQVYNGKKDQINKRIPKEDATEAVHICWGKLSYDRLRSNGCNKAFLAGAIHMDFLKAGFDDWYMPKSMLFEKYGIQENNKTILFMSSFSYFGLSDDSLDEIKKRVDFDPYYFRDLTVESRRFMLIWFKKILDEFEDVNIIYRPHPGELIDDEIIKMTKKYNRFYCISDYSIKQWIKICDMVLNWYSTAGVEAYFAGKHNLFVRPIKFKPELEIEIFNNFCLANSYEEFRNYIKEPQELERYYQNVYIKDKIEESYLNDGTYAYKKICDEIENMINEKDYEISKKNYSARKRFASCLKKLVIGVIYFLWKSNHLTRKIICFNSKLKKVSEYQEFVKGEKISSEEIVEARQKLCKILNDLG